MSIAYNYSVIQLKANFSIIHVSMFILFNEVSVYTYLLLLKVATEHCMGYVGHGFQSDFSGIGDLGTHVLSPWCLPLHC